MRLLLLPHLLLLFLSTTILNSSYCNVLAASLPSSSTSILKLGLGNRRRNYYETRAVGDDFVHYSPPPPPSSSSSSTSSLRRGVVGIVRTDLLFRGGSSSSSATASSSSSSVTASSSSAAVSASSSASSANCTQLSPAVMNGIKNFLASGLAAACSKTLLAPFDTIKTMQQQVVRDSGVGETALGLAEAAKLIMRRPRGFLELYAGLGVSALGAMPSVGLYFGVYSYSKERLAPLYQKALSNYDKPFLTRTLTVSTSAAIGNTVASFSRVPHEVVKQKLQTGQYPSALYGIKDLFQNHGGVKAFFPTGGVRIQMIRDIPYAIFTLLAYECLRDHWVNAGNGGGGVQSTSTTKRPVSTKASSHTTQQRRQTTSTTTTPIVKPWKDMVSGGLSGGIGSYLTNPMDVIKTRLQTDSAMYDGRVWWCVRATYAEGGMRAFLRGSVPRLIHKVPANASFFVFYEFFRRALKVDDAVGS